MKPERYEPVRNYGVQERPKGRSVLTTMIGNRRFIRIVIGTLLLAALALSGCGVYYNTFFNAKKHFNAAEEARKESRRANAGARDYQVAVEKALKVVENHPNSKYYDDAVYMLGVSYYHTQQFGRAERRFRELLANYPESPFVREATLYLAKAKLKLGEMDDAMVRFTQIFEADYDRQFKAEAAEALGSYYQTEREFEQARRYYSAIRDSLGDDVKSREAQMAIADGYFETYQFGDGLGSYLQVLGMEPEPGEKYHALYRAARCSFQLQDIEAGMDYLNQLAQDEMYYDSLGALGLTMGEGYEYDDDLAQAEETYEEVAETSEIRAVQAVALYRLGLIYQIDYDDLERAKEYYDRAASADSRSPIRGDAIIRSSDIGKLSTLARTKLDSTASLAAVDEAAYTQYLLADLYWFNLNKPDSAIIEMQYLVDSFATSYYAPKGLIALAEMIREQYQDDQAADSLLKLVLKNYVHSDYIPQALEGLGLRGTAADTGYARIYVDMAEDILIEENNADSAKVLYRYVVENFPESEYFVPAQFAMLWLDEHYFAPGDSSIILAYQEFADSFPGNEYANLALQQIGVRRAPAGRRRERDEVDGGSEDVASGTTDTTQAAYGVERSEEEYNDPMIALYRGPNGDTLVDLRLDPIETLIPFDFPVNAVFGSQYDWLLYYQLLIDFSGKVVDYILKIPCDVDEINIRASETIGSMTFDAIDVSNRVVDAGVSGKGTEEGQWFVYMYTVTKPEYLR